MYILFQLFCFFSMRFSVLWFLNSFWSLRCPFEKFELISTCLPIFFFQFLLFLILEDIIKYIYDAQFKTLIIFPESFHFSLPKCKILTQNATFTPHRILAMPTTCDHGWFFCGKKHLMATLLFFTGSFYVL